MTDIEQILEDCLSEAEASNSCLTAWEKEFVRNIEDWYSTRNFLTEKQESTLRKIWDKI